MQIGDKKSLMITGTAKKEQNILLDEINYSLTKFIYETLASNSPEFSRELHEVGFKKSKKSFKGVCFSRPYFSDFTLKENGTISVGKFVTIKVRSLVKGFLDNFILGLYKNEKIKISKAEFSFEEIKILPELRFKTEEMFYLDTPLVLSVKDHSTGKAKYLRYLDDREKFKEALKQNLKEKYSTFYGNEIDLNDFDFSFDESYMATAAKHSKLITYCDQRIYGELAPFTIKAPIEVMEMIYYSGIGEKNMMGFGFISKKLKIKGGKV
ncbi:CRISPR-associated endoribonuclease Cas6 [Thermoanaerobacterium sp. PSU-2]|uniref:CRISPR-associated endoribonuclease Cas6 n=1 Tax=Thermoanaerobacterium sp. PSU-2 TaxID=1930849 RepID=UPI000A15BFD4|nr:CRISPR-associated endoribonuclease Cas6 [Thermoanaerobacterium sp. PSU-2]ORX23342.1 CRISPR-associated endoribonuclease Cas6 [Thermoanaerobacterium sp. PSU-2]